MALALAISEDLKECIPLAERVIDQTTRRIIYDEQVPAEEKVVSIFEPHTDIIRKDRRETFYGHKICLTSGRSNLISDCLIVEGNPADSSLPVQMLDRHDQIYGRYPPQSCQRQGDQGCLLCQEAGLERRGYVPQPLDVQEAPAVPGRH